MHLTQATFEELSLLSHRLCGLTLGAEKTYLVRHRLEPLIRARGLASFEDLCLALRQGGRTDLHDEIVEALTTRETSFFRDQHPFEAFRQDILPRLAPEGRRPSSRVRIWSAASSTGQEPYSLAMLVYDWVRLNTGRGLQLNDFSILATDISATALRAATVGVYPLRDVARGLTPTQQSRYGEPVAEGWRVAEPIRRLVEFRRFNLMESFAALGCFDVIFCRNVLIYFDEPTRRRLVEQMRAMLPPHGCLILGAAENLYGISASFESRRVGDTLVYRPS